MSTATDRPLWEPSPALMRGCRLASYLAWLGQRQGRSFRGYHELQLWSTEDLEGFWASIWDYFGVLHHAPYERVLGRRTMPGAEWFPGACLNYAENLLHGSPGETVAIVHSSESRAPGEMTWSELRAAVAQVAGALRALGIRRGDRVASVLPNVPEAVVAFLASASIGAVWSSCSPDLGVEAVVDRFAQVGPKVLLCADGYRYGGRVFDRRDYNAQLRARLPDVRSMIVLEYLGTECWYLDGDATVAWDQLPRLSPPLLEFEPVPFDHPLWILYSSGTTGAPKALVQSHGGILLEHLKTHHLHLDLGPADRFFWFSTTGWMMWNFLVSGLLAGAAIVLYDGHPGYPDLTRLWELAEQAGITVFGTSAAFIDACMTAGVRPTDGHDLGSVRSVGSTGSPLSAAAFDWVYRELGSDTWLFSMSGGTDVCSAFIGGVPLLPVYRGELQAAALGVALDSYDDHGRPQRGRPGELVVTQPMPSMPVFFWGDEDHKRYREAYFGVYPGAWRHGDWLELTQRGTGIIHGRSDSTINRSGIRIGTSEIYRAVLRLPEVVDALVVDITKHGRDGFVVLFVVLRDNGQLDTTTEWRIAERLRHDCSPRHVPDDIVAVAELPRTATGKLLEVPVKRILNGVPLEKAVVRESLANPHALEPFLKLAFASLGLAREAEPCYVSCTDRSVQRLPVRGKEKTMTMITTREAQMEANKAVMRRYIEELWNQRNWDVIDEIIHPDYRSEPPSFPGEWGVADLKENCPPFMAMYPDGKWKTLDMVAEGDRVACAWEFNATHTVDGFGIKATGEKVRVLVIGIYTVRDGKIVSLRKLNVGVDFFTAFGLPQPDPAAA